METERKSLINKADPIYIQKLVDDIVYDYHIAHLPAKEAKEVLHDKLTIRSNFISAHANTKEQQKYIELVDRYHRYKNRRTAVPDVESTNLAFKAIIDFENQLIMKYSEKSKKKFKWFNWPKWF